MLFHSSTGVPVVDAQEDVLRARRAHLAARLVRRASVPRALTGIAGMPRGSARLEVNPLKAVVGTVEPTITFDARFRPASDLVRARRERIALAHRRGVALALTAGGVSALAVGAIVLVTIPAVWVLLGGPRQDASQFGNDHPRRRPCTCTRDYLNPETTR